MAALSATVFALSWWLGLYLLSRDPRKLVLVLAAVGLTSFALVVALDAVRVVSGSAVLGQMEIYLVAVPGIAWFAVLLELSRLDPHPESVPINALVAVKGTPLADRPPIDPLDLVRMCATARITMPNSRVRLSAGRLALSREAQTLCFLAGANSIFYGERLLTTPNNADNEDLALLRDLGAEALVPDGVAAE